MSTAGWIDAACELLQSERDIVRVTVAEVRGSSPREPGATMLVTAASQQGTIGGGQLEWQATEAARRLFAGDAAPVAIMDLRLGPDLAQCCGGEVVLWLERIPAVAAQELRALQDARQADGSQVLRTRFVNGTLAREAPGAPRSWQQDCLLRQLDDGIELTERWLAPRRELWIFGAGHVGQAVVKLLADVPLFNVHWIDSRAALLDCAGAPHVQAVIAAEPAERVRDATSGTAFLVLTHDHELDFQICSAVLARGDASWLGLIGSKSKAARFRGRLRRDGHSEARIATLICPVGLAAIASKLPAAIAVGIVAQLLALTPAPPAGVAVACDPECRRCQNQVAAADHS